MNKNAVNLDVLTVYLESETARVNRERATLEEAVEILEDLKQNVVPEGRRLLGAPSTVAFWQIWQSKVLKLILKLLIVFSHLLPILLKKMIISKPQLKPMSTPQLLSMPTQKMPIKMPSTSMWLL